MDELNVYYRNIYHIFDLVICMHNHQTIKSANFEHSALQNLLAKPAWEESFQGLFCWISSKSILRAYLLVLLLFGKPLLLQHCNFLDICIWFFFPHRINSLSTVMLKNNLSFWLIRHLTFQIRQGCTFMTYEASKKNA